MPESNSLQWRLHSHLDATLISNGVQLQSEQLDDAYQCVIASEQHVQATLEFGYQEAIPVSGGIESDATTDIFHIEWELPAATTHDVVMSCLKSPIELFFDGSKTLAMTLNKGHLVVDQFTVKVKDN
ncbi:hypothetical protein [uncultured Psychromonas sp.]|uniref:hypothetical protein n=1 Tax=uncultured Psychromonas sp. TaxID=173974 RepID=UPI002623E76B|nr:hypothetical protein [uncultured Psychromonas sp.]